MWKEVCQFQIQDPGKRFWFFYVVQTIVDTEEEEQMISED